jgi:hypothetical protein
MRMVESSSRDKYFWRENEPQKKTDLQIRMGGVGRQGDAQIFFYVLFNEMRIFLEALPQPFQKKVNELEGK